MCLAGEGLLFVVYLYLCCFLLHFVNIQNIKNEKTKLDKTLSENIISIRQK